MDLLAHVKHKLAGYRQFLLAYSGGVDSTVLLHLLSRLCQQNKTLSVRAVYIHHGLSVHATLWAQHCQAQCEALQLPFAMINVDIFSPNGGNIEALARQARYQALKTHLMCGEVLLTAQHLDDQCETFFLALKRGSGPAGLSAMPESMPFSHSQLVRPLLAIPREQIEYYASRHHLKWIEDESNQDSRFDRNFLRWHVLPLLTQRWPAFLQMTAKSASLCAGQEQLLDELLAESLTQLVDQQKALDLSALHIMSKNRRWAILRRWFSLHQLTMPGENQLKQLWQDVALAKEDANPQYQINRHQVRRYQNRLYLLPLFQEITDIVLPWQIKTALQLPDNLGILSCGDQGWAIRPPTMQEQVTVRFSAQGSFQIIGRHGSRKIKKLWQEFNVPSWQRSRIPLVFYNESLITAVNMFVTVQGCADTSSIYLQLTHMTKSDN